MRILHPFPSITAGILAMMLAPVSQAEAPVPDPGLSREQGTAILEELRQIRLHLQRIEAQGQPPSAPVPQQPSSSGKVSLPVGASPILGKPDAPVTLVEFVDFQCTFCQRFFRDTYPKLNQTYVEKGKLRILVKDMPLGFHKEARMAAHAARCAGDQGRYWTMHDRLFETGKLSDADLGDQAAAIGLDRSTFNDCMSAGRHLAQIDQDSADAREAGISGTPSFVVGVTTGERLTGTLIRGAQPTETFVKRIEAALGEANPP